VLVFGDAEIQRLDAPEVCAFAEKLHILRCFGNSSDALVDLTPGSLISRRLDGLNVTHRCPSS